MSTKYKKYIHKFEEGTPLEWINVMRDVTEIWTQNSINEGLDQAATVHALVRGETLTSFEAALQDARTNEDGSKVAITVQHVMMALDAMQMSIFPHPAWKFKSSG